MRGVVSFCRERGGRWRGTLGGEMETKSIWRNAGEPVAEGLFAGKLRVRDCGGGGGGMVDLLDRSHCLSVAPKLEKNSG